MLTPEAIAELETKYGRIAVVNGKRPTATEANPKPEPSWQAVFRAPKRVEWKMFKSHGLDAHKKVDCMETLCLQTVVYPERAAFDALLDDYPGIPEACVDAIRALVGAASDDVGNG